MGHAGGGTFTHVGEHYRLTDSPALPKPDQARPPIIIGGKGIRRTPVLAAHFADEFNLPFVDLATTRSQFANVRRACEAIGREPESMTWSNALVLCVGEDEAEVQRRADAIGREPAELRANGLAGTPEEVVERIGQYAEAGAERIYLQVLDLFDLDHLELVAERVLPQVR